MTDHSIVLTRAPRRIELREHPSRLVASYETYSHGGASESFGFRNGDSTCPVECALYKPLFNFQPCSIARPSNTAARRANTSSRVSIGKAWSDDDERRLTARPWKRRPAAAARTRLSR